MSRMACRFTSIMVLIVGFIQETPSNWILLRLYADPYFNDDSFRGIRFSLGLLYNDFFIMKADLEGGAERGTSILKPISHPFMRIVHPG